MLKLIYTDKDGAAAEYVVGDEPVTIGRSGECDVRLADEDVGRLHVLVSQSNGKLRIRDQESRTGTWVNGERVTEAGLADGDEFRLGAVSFKVALEKAGASSGRTSDGKADGDGRRRARRAPRPKREVLGGAKLTKRQQTLIKIVCAAIMAGTAAAAMGLLNRKKTQDESGSITIERKIYVRPLDEPKKCKREATDLWREARDAEAGGETQEAYELIRESKEKIERAQELYQKIIDEHSGEGFQYLQKDVGEIISLGQGIKDDWLRLKMQVERDGGDGDGD